MSLVGFASFESKYNQVGTMCCAPFRDQKVKRSSSHDSFDVFAVSWGSVPIWLIYFSEGATACQTPASRLFTQLFVQLQIKEFMLWIGVYHSEMDVKQWT